MAEKSDSRDPDGSWVLAGTEGLPVDTVGPAQNTASHEDEDEDEDEDEECEEEGAQDAGTADGSEDGATPLGQNERPKAGGLEEHLDPGADTEPTPGGPTECSAAQSWEQEEPDTERAPPPGTHTGPLLEEGSCTSSDDDVEGLRRRHGHEPRAGGPPPTPPPRRGPQDEGDEDGLSMNKVLLGAAALLAVALLIVSGGFYDAADGPMESAVSRSVEPGPVPTEGSDSAQSPPLPGTEDPRSVQSVSALLDKLAKENHDIRLMQAELQAHKEELQALLQQSEGAAEAQRQSLAAENAELRAALQREGDALRAARAELQHLRAEGGGSSPQPPLREAKQPHGAAHQEEAQRHSSTRHRELLAAVRHELAAALQRAGGTGGGGRLTEELRALEERLGRELEAGGDGAFPGPWKKAFKAERKESRRHKHGAPPEHGAPQEWGGRERKEQRKAHGHGKEPRPPREHKPGKTGGKWSHTPHYELPPLGHFRTPQGCSGVAECARKEGREVLGAVLEPVQKAQFLQLLEGFMGRLGWGGHFGGVAARLEGAFGADGAFAHDRLRFVDFVDAVEEILEALARREHGDVGAADGFEEFVLRHYGGGGGPVGKERGRKPWKQHGGGR